METALCLLLWDVDHTLIENAGVSKEIYLKAFELLVGRFATASPETDGRTDVAIMENLIAANDENPQDFSWDRQATALRQAGQLKKSELADRGHALAGARETLLRLAQQSDIAQGPLTGNIEDNARVKLSAFDLDRWLDFEVGAFGSESRRRSDLVAVAQRKAAAKLDFLPTRNSTVLIGDTPLDVEAGLLGGAHVLAVATGPASVDELLAAGADAALSDLTDWDAFTDALAGLRGKGAVGPRQPAGA